jgi:hypothetical protein
MNAADLHAMGRARTALTDAKNELIRSGAGSDLTLRQLRDAEAGLGRQMEQHQATVEAVAQFIPAQR